VNAGACWRVCVDCGGYVLRALSMRFSDLHMERARRMAPGEGVMPPM